MAWTDDSGVVWCWGRNNFGQCGVPASDDAHLAASVRPAIIVTPRPVPQFPGGGGGGDTFSNGVCRVAAGAEHSLALTRAGQLWSWGWNEHGNLGQGDTTDRDTPTLVPLPMPVRAHVSDEAGCASAAGVAQQLTTGGAAVLLAM